MLFILVHDMKTINNNIAETSHEKSMDMNKYGQSCIKWPLNQESLMETIQMKMYF